MNPLTITSVSFLVLFLVFCATPPVAYGDAIALYGDTLRTDCIAIPNVNLLASFVIFHYSASGTSGSQFRIPRPVCMSFDNIVGPILLQAAFPTVGNLESGIKFQYGECLTGWIRLGWVVYFDPTGLGGWPVCCEQPVLAHPAAASGQVEEFDCVGSSGVVPAFSGVISISGGCSCSVVTGIQNQTTTWGVIKEMYKASGRD